jgi:hypothetical protein
MPNLGSRSLFVGQTGSGKTYAALKVLGGFYGYRQIQILDTKGDDSISEIDAPILTRLEDLPAFKFADYPVVIYRPEGAELADLKTLDAWCEWIYERGHTVAYIDELTQLGNSTSPKMGFLNMLSRGRSKDVTVLMATQRPVGIPKIAYTETQYFYRFYLADIQDRKRVAEFSHPAMIYQPKAKYGFLFFHVGERKVYEFNSIEPKESEELEDEGLFN